MFEIVRDFRVQFPPIPSSNGYYSFERLVSSPWTVVCRGPKRNFYHSNRHPSLSFQLNRLFLYRPPKTKETRKDSRETADVGPLDSWLPEPSPGTWIVNDREKRPVPKRLRNWKIWSLTSLEDVHGWGGTRTRVRGPNRNVRGLELIEGLWRTRFDR